MSISNPPAKNPCGKFIDFKAGEGIFTTWDKENEKNVEIPFPIHFVLIDELATVTGFHRDLEVGIFSNEVHNLNEEPLRVRTYGKDKKKGIDVAEGLWASVKDKVTAAGGKYTKSAYVLLINDDGTTEFANIKIPGGANEGWINAKVGYKNIWTITGVEDREKGSGKNKIEWKVPVIKSHEMKEKYYNEAVILDETLQAYFELYKKNRQNGAVQESVPESADKTTPDEDSDWESRPASREKEPVKSRQRMPWEDDEEEVEV